ncbi:MAG: Holliday junction resolvase RuvX [candidate division Zixibacteria bacterium]|nr:Holliday junction resolvase RuvX [candidate division Zixibacteria bacterium]
MRLLGIDYGRKRIGLALSDPAEKMVTPYGTIIVESTESLLEELSQIIREEEVELIILGDPVRDDGKRSELHDEIVGFANRLKEKTGLDVKLWDEYFTSRIAEEKLHSTGRKLKGNKGKIDSLAAAEILQGYIGSK